MNADGQLFGRLEGYEAGINELKPYPPESRAALESRQIVVLEQ
jgi:hypothetical protein